VTAQKNNVPFTVPRSIVQGGPGAGKSQCWKALAWFAFQHGLAHRVAVVAYTWRAAAYASTASHVGMSTTTFFNLGGIMRRSGAVPSDVGACTERAKRLRHKWIIFVDEVGTVGLQHLGFMEAAVRSVAGAPRTPEAALLSGYTDGQQWGTMGIVLLGDLDQLDPVSAAPMHKIPTATSNAAFKAGHRVWRDFTQASFLGSGR